jgi:hypothetical protein
VTAGATGLEALASTSPDLPAIAAYAVHYELGADAAAVEWRFIAEEERVRWRAVADAVVTAAELTLPDDEYRLTDAGRERLAAEAEDREADEIAAEDDPDLDDDGSGPSSQLHEGDWDDAVSEATS